MSRQEEFGLRRFGLRVSVQPNIVSAELQVSGERSLVRMIESPWAKYRIERLGRTNGATPYEPMMSFSLASTMALTLPSYCFVNSWICSFN